MSKQLKPRFLLKGVDMKTLLQAYIEGNPESPNLPERPKKRTIITEKKERTQNLIAHNTPYDPIYEVKHRGEDSIILTTGIEMFSSILKLTVDENNRMEIAETNTPCIYCRVPGPLKNPVPAVITNFYVRDGKHVYEGYDLGCDFPCAKAHLKTLYASDPNNHIYMGSFTHLNSLFYRKAGKSEIPILPDWRLLNINGGSMSPEQFYGAKETYHQLPNVVSLPCKLQFSSRLVS